MPVYLDPTDPGYPHPQFFTDVFERPPRPDWLPLERLACLALAWLADRDRGFALELVRLFCGEQGATPAGDRAIGARAGITLPRADAASVFPDISLDVEGRALQVLVEVKVDAEFHTHESAEGETIQPLTYANAWASLPDDGSEARSRWLGTLTRSPDLEVAAGAWPAEAVRRARDVRWSEVLAVLEQVADAGETWGRIAAELRTGMAVAMASPPPPASLDPVLIWGAGLLETLAPAVSKRLSGCTLGSRLQPRSDYVGRYLRIVRSGREVQMWLMVSTAEGRYNGDRREANLWLASRPDFQQPEWLGEALEGGGFAPVSDDAGFGYRRRRAVAEVQSLGDDSKQLLETTDWVVRMLEGAGFATGA